MRKVASLAFGMIVTAGLAFPSLPVHASDKDITIGTGGTTGVYYTAGDAICRFVNKNSRTNGLRCWVESTGGSIYNINTLRAGRLDMGMAQSDWQFHALKGSSVFNDAGPYTDLRAIFSIYPEPFTVLARKDSGVKSFADFKGKRFNIGNPGSGTRASLEELLAAMEWTTKSFSVATELQADQQGGALCDNKIDGFFYAVGHPSASIQEPTTACDAKLIPLTGPAVDKLVKDNPYYTYAVIPGGLYANNPEPTRTYGAMATLLAPASLSPDVVYQVVKAVFENLDEFKKTHPAFARLNPKKMIKSGLSAPLHEGAERYYKERGWM